MEYKFTDRNSDNMLADRLKNFFKVSKNTCEIETEMRNPLFCPQVAVYFEPDQSVITKITKDAKMTWSDKISWVRQVAYICIREVL